VPVLIRTFYPTTQCDASYSVSRVADVYEVTHSTTVKCTFAELKMTNTFILILREPIVPSLTILFLEFPKIVLVPESSVESYTFIRVNCTLQKHKHVPHFEAVLNPSRSPPLYFLTLKINSLVSLKKCLKRKKKSLSSSCISFQGPRTVPVLRRLHLKWRPFCEWISFPIPLVFDIIHTCKWP